MSPSDTEDIPPRGDPAASRPLRLEAPPRSAPERPIEVVVAEKNPLLQGAVVRLLQGDGRFVVLAVAADGERFLTAVERFAFDIGLIGWEMPYLNGPGVLEKLRPLPQPKPRILVYTGSPDPDIPRRAMALGAAGFCTKAGPPEKLLDALAQVAAGRMVFPFVDVARLDTRPLDHLTGRERQLLAALADGLTNAQMAERLGISLNTVKFHLKNLFEKLGITNRAQAVAAYLKAQER
ncbi:LuxR C-terminal-related transcriptional regulator [Roseospirillum parvum]|uniref:Two-component system, NarL family, nitrate/nitrite response regulator NarP n=1 Tax=Roseospirillum parvum TaxID=83401 RepID=A0A1G7UDD6_9PROT|nr:response regulator transcription factor [Roseospirillum parvum]SDG45493.1 two-component system, NarL family, nitrate/nitrite response regulator NarP [Roseospirillum parvum]